MSLEQKEALCTNSYIGTESQQIKTTNKVFHSLNQVKMNRKAYFDKESIRQALSIERLLEHYDFELLPRKKLRCPFHGEDRNPSAFFKNNFFYCFTCQKHLDIFGFIQEMEDCSFKEAIQKAADITGIQPSLSGYDFSENIKRNQHDRSEQKRITLSSEGKYDLLVEVARIYRQSNPEWMPQLDTLLDTWLQNVPLWADLRSLYFAFQNENKEQIQVAVIRLYQELEVYHV